VARCENERRALWFLTRAGALKMWCSGVAAAYALSAGAAEVGAGRVEAAAGASCGERAPGRCVGV